MLLNRAYALIWSVNCYKTASNDNEAIRLRVVNEEKQNGERSEREKIDVDGRAAGVGPIRPHGTGLGGGELAERRLGTTTGMGQTNRLPLASRESPGVIHGDL